MTREDVQAYADAGGDHNPLHRSDEFAHSVGFDGAIAHGMFTMGHMAACLVAWAGEADAVSAISAQFRATVSMGQEIVAGGRVRAIDTEARTAVLELWARRAPRRARSGQKSGARPPCASVPEPERSGGTARDGHRLDRVAHAIDHDLHVVAVAFVDAHR